MTDQDLKKIRTIVKEEAGSAEQRLRTELASKEDLETTVTSAEQRIVGEIGKFLEDHLLPIIDQKADKTDIDRIERKLNSFAFR